MYFLLLCSMCGNLGTVYLNYMSKNVIPYDFILFVSVQKKKKKMSIINIIVIETLKQKKIIWSKRCRGT